MDLDATRARQRAMDNNPIDSTAWQNAADMAAFDVAPLLATVDLLRALLREALPVVERRGRTNAKYAVLAGRITHALGGT